MTVSTSKGVKWVEKTTHVDRGFHITFFGFIVDFVLNGLCKKPFQGKNMEYRVKQKNEKFSAPFVIYFFENEKIDCNYAK